MRTGDQKSEYQLEWPDGEAAEIFNKFFHSVFTNTTEILPQSSEQLFNVCVTEIEFFEALTSLKSLDQTTFIHGF